MDIPWDVHVWRQDWQFVKKMRSVALQMPRLAGSIASHNIA